MSSNNITIGVDLGDRRHAVCVLSAAGEILAEELIVNSRECLTAFAQRYPAATFVKLLEGVMPRMFGSAIWRRR